MAQVSLIRGITQSGCRQIDEYNGREKMLAVIDTDRFVDLATQVDPSQDTQ